MDDKESKAGAAGSKKAKPTMRESAAKSRANAEKPKRVRRAASVTTKSAGKVKSALTQHYHVLPSSEDKFLTKPRRMTPGYVVNSARELKHVSWPKNGETWRLVFAVFMFAAVMGLVVALLDYGLERILREVIL